MRNARVIGAAVAAALAVVSFLAGASWNGRHQTKVDVERARFFEAAQGQFQNNRRQDCQGRDPVAFEKAVFIIAHGKNEGDQDGGE